MAPYYLPEPSSERVETFLSRERPGTFAVSYWTEVEFASLLARDVRMSNLQIEMARAVLRLFSRDMERIYRVLTPTQDDFCEATRLLLPHIGSATGLRGPDALHLAIAKRYTTLYTLDKPLLRAAHALGISASGAGIL